MSSRDDLGAAIEDVVATGRCSGCGGCAALSGRVQMALNDEGHLRPTLNKRLVGDEESASVVTEFRKVCPGVGVHAPSRGSHGSVAGTALEVWRAWALDAEFRRRGSSGGVLTAISALLRDEGLAVVGSAIDLPRSRVVPLTLRTKEDVLRAAGSKYAPVAVVGSPEIRSADAVVAKPCESFALRELELERAPIVLSFFCAGTPSALATDETLRASGVRPHELVELRYRGDGWPGTFHARDIASNQVTHDYETSWGQLLGPTMQQRCKFCVDGVGEHADLVAGDFWQADEGGRPSFDEGEGVSVLIARTQRGRELALRAAERGVLRLERTSLAEAMAVQPHQSNRRLTLWGRLAGARVAGATVTRYPGFGLWRHAIRHPLLNARALVGSFLRIRRSVRDRRAQTR